ncbi:MAG: DUF501 domain-containing protein [Candidatus Geothermincolia bacterium]
MELTPLSGADYDLVQEQLGREPRGAVYVASRCPFGKVQVIITSPMVEGETPFPTLFWLTCPLLKRDIGRLESSPFRGYLAERLANDPIFAQRLREAEDSYKWEREKLAEKLGVIRLLTGVFDGKDGIGGTCAGGLKCFHAHYAQWLITRNNPVGEAIEEEIAGLQSRICLGTCGHYRSDREDRAADEPEQERGLLGQALDEGRS